MNLVEVAEQIGDAVATTGLRVMPIGTAVHPPAAIVGLPESIEFDQTYGRGMDTVRLPLFVLLGRASDRAAAASLFAYLSGGGAQSVKAALEAGMYTACDDVRAATAAAGVITAEGVDYLGATYDLIIIGRGAE